MTAPLPAGLAEQIEALKAFVDTSASSQQERVRCKAAATRALSLCAEAWGTRDAALTKINAIRNSIIGAQKFNWSEHAYPLVAALDAVGFEGLPYPEARMNFGTLIERITHAETEISAQAARIAALEGLIYRNCDPGGMTQSDEVFFDEIIGCAVLQEKNNG